MSSASIMFFNATVSTFVVQPQGRMQNSMAFRIVKRASCGIRAHDLPLTERVLYQLS